MDKPTHPNAEAFPKGVGGPALRALANAGIKSVSDLTRWTEKDFSKLHGIGPKALTILKAELKEKGKSFRSG